MGFHSLFLFNWTSFPALRLSWVLRKIAPILHTGWQLPVVQQVASGVKAVNGTQKALPATREVVASPLPMLIQSSGERHTSFKICRVYSVSIHKTDCVGGPLVAYSVQGLVVYASDILLWRQDNNTTDAYSFTSMTLKANWTAVYRIYM